MHFSITSKLLLAFFLSTVVAVVSVLALMNWSFKRGFLQYVTAVEREVQDNLIKTLQEEYSRHGSWRFLVDDHQRWYELHFDSIMNSQTIRERIERENQLIETYQPMSPDRPGLDGAGSDIALSPEYERELFRRNRFRYMTRMILLDRDQRLVVGRMRNMDAWVKRPIRVDGQVVGYLGSAPVTTLYDMHDLRFTQEQDRAYLLIALLVIAILTVATLPLSRHLVRPIKNITAATRELASGKYNVRIAEGGTDELGRLARDFNLLATSLEQNETARRQWIADISHELRTPLSIVRGEVESLQDGVRKPTPERIASLHGGIMNLNRLVNDLYELSMSDIGALSYHKDTVDLERVLETAIASLRDDFERSNIKVSLVSRTRDGVEIFADVERLRQLFINLLTNSLRYTDAGGELNIEISNGSGKVVVDFKDSGPGVAPEDLPRLFDRLYRPDASRNRRYGGAGLGLSICRNIVVAHEGTINASPSPLGGVWIHVELPREV